jgi:hypothetical protein
MRKFFSKILATSVKSIVSTNTFSGQGMDGLWVSRAQASRLSPTLLSDLPAMWVNSALSTQEAPADHTGFPTVLFANFTDALGRLSPQSTGPIKRPNKVYKGKLVSR